jgi:spermidine/putrescine-binding protein
MLHQVASFRTRHFAANFILAGALGLLSLMPAAASQSVSLNWNPSTDPNVAGYKIYYGPA